MPQLPFVSSPSNRLERESLHAVVNNMTDGVLALDASFNVTMSNGVALSILDLNDAAGKNIDAVAQLTDKAGQPISLSKVIESQQLGSNQRHFANRDWQLHYADGTTIYIYISVAPVQFGFGRGQDGGYVVLLRDITGEKTLEEERSEFISVVSHELGTPVTIAEGNISNALLAADKEHTPESIKLALKNAHDQILLLSNLLKDISTLSRAEQGKLGMDHEEFEVDELVKSLLDDFRSQVLKKNLNFDYKGDKSLGNLFSSRLYVHEILQNFISNAIKYTEKGGLMLGASRVDDGVEFWVSDTGIGIGRNEHSRVSEKFFRSSDYRVRRVNGTGIGLYVAGKLAKLIGGRISFESELNKGSIFKLFAPNIE